MPTFRKCRYCGQFHDLADWPDNHRDPEPEHSPLARPFIATDTMDETEHPFDGRHYTSKSNFRKTTKAGGGIEVGNDPARFKSKKHEPDKAAIRASIMKAKQKVFGV